MDSESTPRTRLRVIEGRSTHADARRAWSNSRQRYSAISVIVYLVAGLYGVTAEVENPWAAALVPAGGYLVAGSVLKSLRVRWMRRYLKASQESRVVDLGEAERPSSE